MDRPKQSVSVRSMSHETNKRSRLNRRAFLRTAAVGAAFGGGVSPVAASWFEPRRSMTGFPNAQPDARFQELLAGNQRFVANRMTSLDEDLAILRDRTVDKQKPFAAILSCADSRVPVELVFDQSIGRLFVTRVAGNIVTPEIIASIEYAVAELGVGAILVLGHSSCGAVKAAMKTATVPGQISALYQHLRPAVESSAGDVSKAVEANARLQAGLLRTSSTVIHEAETKGTIKVAAAVYDLATGKVVLS